MLRLSNFLMIDNFLLFKEKSLAYNNTDINNFIHAVSDIISNKNLSIENQVRQIYGYMVSDINILNFLLENVFDYELEQVEELQIFIEKDPDDKDRSIIFEELVKQGINNFQESKEIIDESIYDNILAKLNDVSYDKPYDVPDNIEINNVIYLVEGDFLICFIKGKGWNFEKINVSSYKSIEDLLNLNKTPVVDVEFTNEIFRHFTFEIDSNWEEDLFSIVEEHYNELGEDIEHTNLYGETENFTKLIQISEIVYGLYFYGNLLLTNVWSEYMSSDNERWLNGSYNVEEEAFSENYPSTFESFDSEVYSFEGIFNRIKTIYESDFVWKELNNILNNFNLINGDTLDLNDIKLNFANFIQKLNDLNITENSELIPYDENYEENYNYDQLMNWSLFNNEQLVTWVNTYLKTS